MPTLRSHTPAAAQVMALYHDGCEFFDLPEGATFIELAGFLDDLATTHEREPIAVNLRFDSRLPRTKLPCSGSANWPSNFHATRK